MYKNNNKMDYNTIQYNKIKSIPPQIHQTAVIEEGARIGKNVKVGAFCVIGGNVVIGDNCELKAHVVIEGNTTIGKDNVIFPFAVIGQNPQDLKYKGEPSKIKIGNNNRIREHCTIHPGTRGDKMITKIGNNNLLMVNTHVAHDCIIGNNCIFANNATLGGHVHVENNVVVGGMSAIHQFVRIGKHAMIGGMTGVERDVIPYGVVVEPRNTSLEGINLIGLKRRDFTKKQINELRHFYKEVFCGENGNIFEILEDIKEKYSKSKVVLDVIKFLSVDSKRHFIVKK
jgi:UDP-N-acetylglucosamine acyltransferase